MPDFLYRTLSPTGKALKGKITAPDKQAAVRQLTEKGINLLEMAELGKDRFDWSRLAPQPSPSGMRKGVLHATEQLATLLESGIMLDRALPLVSNVMTDRRLRASLERVREAMRGGAALSEALEEERAIFPPFYAGLIRAGENGAGLDFAFRQLATYLKQTQEISNRIRSALIYPFILMGMIFVTLLIVFFYVLPQFKDIFAGSVDKLPAATRAVLAIGEHLEHAGWIYLVLAAVSPVAVKWGMKQTPVKRLWHGLLLSPHFLFGLPRKMEASRFCRTGGTLLRGGLPAPSVLATCRVVSENTVFAAKIGELERAVREGRQLSDALPQSGLLPPMGQEMVDIGEKSGKLDTMMLAAANMMDEDIRNAVERLLAAMVPVLTILMGVVVAAVIGSLMMGIVSMNRLAF